MNRFLFCFSVFVLGASSFAAVEELTSEGEQPVAFVLCRNQDTVRTIRIRNSESGRCETLYSKGGQDRVVGFGQAEQSCSQFLENIRDNLQDANWSCRQVDRARVVNAQNSP